MVEWRNVRYVEWGSRSRTHDCIGIVRQEERSSNSAKRRLIYVRLCECHDHDKHSGIVFHGLFGSFALVEARRMAAWYLGPCGFIAEQHLDHQRSASPIAVTSERSMQRLGWTGYYSSVHWQLMSLSAVAAPAPESLNPDSPWSVIFVSRPRTV